MRFVPPSPASDGSKKSSSASAQFMKALKKNGGKASGATGSDATERYQSILKEKMADVRSQAMMGGSYGFHLPGTDPSECRQLSAGAQEILQKIAERKAKKAAKKEKKEDIISITPKYLTGIQGGRIDKSGKIFDSKGAHILTIDKKTGKIKNEKTGCSVGTYKPNCGFSQHRIAELVAKYDSSKKGSLWGTTPAAPSGGGGNIWGHSDDGKNNWW